MNEAQITPIPTVEISLDEYKAFLEWQIKGPTVEIPLEEYDRLREEIKNLQVKLMCAENHINDLQYEIEHRKDLDEQTDVVAHMVADEMAEKIIKSVSDSVTQTVKNNMQKVRYIGEAKEDIDNGRI